jgi:uncharacterized protein
LEFTWDEAKNQKNVAKHGFTFQTAKLVFDDPYHLLKQDREVDGEPRWQAIGMVEGIHILFVAFVTDEDSEKVRIISARKANSQERVIYGENG